MQLIIYSCNQLFAETLSSCFHSGKKMCNTVVCTSMVKLKSELQKQELCVALIDLGSGEPLSYIKELSLQHKNTRFVALSVPEVDIDILACLNAGFIAYVPKNCTLKKLQHVLKLAEKGECECDSKITGVLINELRRRHINIPDKAKAQFCFSDSMMSLTPREREVLLLLNKGLSNKEIAKNLAVTTSTIKNHLHKVYAKFEVSRRTEIIAMINENSDLLSAMKSNLYSHTASTNSLNTYS